MSWIFFSFLRDSGAIPKESIQSQQQQATKVKKPKSSALQFFPLSLVRVDSAIDSSYLQVLQDPKKKATAVKSRLKRPPTQERMESIFPIVLLTVSPLVERQMLKSMQRVVERETAFVAQFYMQFPVTVLKFSTGKRLVSVQREYQARLSSPTVPIVFEKARNMLFSRTYVIALSLSGVRMVSRAKNLTLKQSLVETWEVTQLLMLAVVSQEASKVWLQVWICRLRYSNVLEPAQPARDMLCPLWMQSICPNPKALNCASKSVPYPLQSEALQGLRRTAELVGVPPTILF